MLKQVLTAVTLALTLPSAYAIPQKLAINFRSPRIGAQIPISTPVTPQPGYDPVQINLKDGIVLADTNGAPFIWSHQYGLSAATGYDGGEHMMITGLTGITGMLIDDIKTPYIPTPNGPLIPIQATEVPYFTVGVNGGPFYFLGDNTTSDGGVIIDYGPLKNGTEFISFSQPVDEVNIGQYISSFAVAGFTTSEQAKHHVPEGGSTLLLLGGGLLSLMGVARLARSGKSQPCCN
jgi:hypothetical protein